MKLQGKVALVTGAGSGIGRQAVLALARAGASVMATDVNDTGGAETIAEAVREGGTARYLHQDVRSEDEWIATIRQTVEAFGALHILVNNAGIGLGRRIVDMSLADWNRQLEINLTGVFLGCKHGIPALRAAGGGSIINISSVAGLQGAVGLGGYCATKGGVRLLTKSIAKEYAADGIRCNSVHPGIIETPIWDVITDNDGLSALIPGAPAGSAGIANRLTDTIARVAPIQRPGTPVEVANGIVFLASDDSSFMTGSELVIDGGLSA